MRQGSGYRKRKEPKLFYLYEAFSVNLSLYMESFVLGGGMEIETFSPDLLLFLHVLKIWYLFNSSAKPSEFSLQITRGVDFTLSSAANNLCRHICPCLSTSAQLDFLQHTRLKSLSNNTLNTATSTCRNYMLTVSSVRSCLHTCCTTGRDLSIK